MNLKLHKYRPWEVVFFICFYLLVFQNPLIEYVSEVFTYVDEIFPLLGIFFLIYWGCGANKKLTARRDTLNIAALLMVFVLCGVSANIIYEYQPTRLVLKDLFVNIKFFLSIITGFYLFQYVRLSKERLLWHACFCITILFMLLAIDVVFNIFPSPGYRYGMKVRNLIFGHVTYLVGACMFLLSILMACFEKKNIKYIVMTMALLLSTVRSKAIVGATAYLFILYFILLKRKKIKMWHILVIAAVGLYIAWDQISFYYIELAERSARAVMTQTSLQIMKDYFPIGTGFGTYASAVAGEHYSPVYVLYGFPYIYELRISGEFFSDTFWPIIIGQTGAIGTMCYIFALVRIFLKTIKVRFLDQKVYASVLFVCVYLLISSTSESAFCNAISIPLAMMLGYAVYVAESVAVNERKYLPRQDRVEQSVLHTR